MYTHRNFKTKKELKEAVEAYNAYQELMNHPDPTSPTLNVSAVLAHKHFSRPPQPITVFQPGPFGGNEPTDGSVALEGPHYPEPHRWYASAVLKDGKVVKVK